MELIGLQAPGEGRKILPSRPSGEIPRQVAPLGGAGGEHGVWDFGLMIEDWGLKNAWRVVREVDIKEHEFTPRLSDFDCITEYCVNI